MKRHIAGSGSCSCTNCVYKSRSQLPSVQRLIETGSKIDKLYFGKYLPLRERKLLGKLIRTRTAYDDVRAQLLSASGSSDLTKDSRSLDDDSTERSSAVTKIVDLVDRGHIRSPGTSKLSSCCSCCSCSSMKKIRVEKHPRIHRHSVPYDAIAKYTAEAQKKGRDRRNRLSTKVSSKLRAVRFKVKRVRSAPCTCTLGISSALRRASKGHLKIKHPNEIPTSTTETPAKTNNIGRKTIKCICKPMKSIRRIKHTKNSSTTGESEGTTGKKIRVKKDSLMIHRERLKKNTALKAWECEPGVCVPEACVPQECLKKIKARYAGRKKIYQNKLSGTDLSQSHVSINTKNKVSNANVGIGLNKKIKCICPTTTTSSETNTEAAREIKFKKEEPSVIGANIRPQVEKKRTKMKNTSSGEKQTKNKSKGQTKKKVSNANVGKGVIRKIKCICSPTTISSETNTEVAREIKLEKEEPRVIGENIRPQKEKKRTKIKNTSSGEKQTKIRSNVHTKKKLSNANVGKGVIRKIQCVCSPTPTSSEIITPREIKLEKEEPSVIGENIRPHVEKKRTKTKNTSSGEKQTKNKSKVQTKKKVASANVGKGVKRKIKCICSPTTTSSETTTKKPSKEQAEDVQQTKTNQKEISQSASGTSIAYNRKIPVQKRQYTAEELESIPSRQAINIGSSFSFNVEFYKETSSDIDGPAVVEGKVIREELYNSPTKKTTQERGHRIRKRHGSQSILSLSRKITNVGQGLKRCVCTLKIPKRKQKPHRPTSRKTMTSLYSQKVDVVGRMKETQTKPFKNHGASVVYVTPPLTSKPRSPLPYSCECEEETNIRSRNGSKYFSEETNKIRKPKSKYRKSIRPNTAEMEKSDLLLDQSSRQVVRIGSSFSFNIEFSKERMGYEPEINEIQEQPRVDKKHYREKGIKIERKHYRDKGIKVHKPRPRHITSQTKNIEKSKQTHTKRGVDKCICPSNILQEKSTVTPPEYIQGSEVLMKHVAIVTVKEKKNHRNKATLLPYECEPGVCIPYECDPYECEKLIKMKTAKSQSPNTKSRQSQVAVKRSKINAKKKGRNERDIMVTPSQSGIQVVRFGSSFNFNIEFYKERPSVDELKIIKVPHDKVACDRTRRHSVKRAKLKEEAVQKFERCAHHESSNTEIKVKDKGISGNSAIKRCFCTLKVQKKDKYSKKKKEKNPMDRISQSVISNKINFNPKYCRHDVCDPHENCKETNQQHRKRVKHHHTNNDNNLRKPIAIKSNEVNIQEKQNRHRQITQQTQRQAVRVGSTFDFNINISKQGGHAPKEQPRKKKKNPKKVKPKKPPVIKVKKERKPLNVGLKLKNIMGAFKLRLNEIGLKLKKIKFRRSRSQYTMVKVKKPKPGEPVTAAFFQVVRDVDNKAMNPNLHNYAYRDSKYLNVISGREDKERRFKNRQFHEAYSVSEDSSDVLFKENYSSYGISHHEQNSILAQKHTGSKFSGNYLKNCSSKQSFRYDSCISYDMKSRIEGSVMIKTSELCQLRANKYRYLNNTQAMKSPFQSSFYAFNVQVPNAGIKIEHGNNRTPEKIEREPGFCVPGEWNPIEYLNRINSSLKSTKSSKIDHLNLSHKSIRSFTEPKFVATCRNAQSNQSPTPTLRSSKGKSEIRERSITNLFPVSSRHVLYIGSSLSCKAECYEQRNEAKGKAMHIPKSIKSSRANKYNTHSTTVCTMKKPCRSTKAQKTINNKNKVIGPMLQRCSCALKLQKKTVRKVKKSKTKSEYTMPNKPFGNIILSQNRMVMAEYLKPYESAPGLYVAGEYNSNEYFTLIRKRLSEGRQQSVSTVSAKFKSNCTKSNKEHKTKHIQSKVHRTRSRRDNKHASKKGYQDDKVQTNFKQAVKFGSDISFHEVLELPSGYSTHVGKGRKKHNVKSETIKKTRHGKTQEQGQCKIYSVTNIKSPKPYYAKGDTSFLEKCLCTLKLKKIGDGNTQNSKKPNKSHKINKNNSMFSTSDKLDFCDVKNTCPDNIGNHHEKETNSRRKRSKNTQVYSGKHSMSVKSDIPKTSSFYCKVHACTSNSYDSNDLFEKHRARSLKGFSKRTLKNDIKAELVANNNARKNSQSQIKRHVCALTYRIEYDRNKSTQKQNEVEKNTNLHQNREPCRCLSKHRKSDQTQVNKHAKSDKGINTVKKYKKQVQKDRKPTELAKSLKSETRTGKSDKSTATSGNRLKTNSSKISKKKKEKDVTCDVNCQNMPSSKYKTEKTKSNKESKTPKKRNGEKLMKRNGHSFEINGLGTESEIIKKQKSKKKIKQDVKARTDTSYHGLYPCFCADKEINKRTSNKEEIVKKDNGLCPMCKLCEDNKSLLAILTENGKLMMEGINKFLTTIRAKCAARKQESQDSRDIAMSIPLFEMVINKGDMSIMNKEIVIDKVKSDQRKISSMIPAFEMVIDKNDTSIINTDIVRNELMKDEKTARNKNKKSKREKHEMPMEKPVQDTKTKPRRKRDTQQESGFSKTDTSYHGLYPCFCPDNDNKKQSNQEDEIPIETSVKDTITNRRRKKDTQQETGFSKTGTSYHGLYPCFCADKEINEKPSNQEEIVMKDDGFCPTCKHCKDKKPLMAILKKNGKLLMEGINKMLLMEGINKMLATLRAKCASCAIRKQDKQSQDSHNIVPLFEMVVNKGDMTIINKEDIIAKVISSGDRQAISAMSPSFEMAIDKKDASIINRAEVGKILMQGDKSIETARSKNIKSKSFKDQMSMKTPVKGTKSERQAYSLRIHGKDCKCCYCANKQQRKKDTQRETGSSRNRAYMDGMPAYSKRTTIRPCICGSEGCKKELQKQNDKLEEEKRAKKKPCVCGSNICGAESKKVTELYARKAITKKEEEKRRPKSQKPDLTAIVSLLRGQIGCNEFKHKIRGETEEEKRNRKKSLRAKIAEKARNERKKAYSKDDNIRKLARIKSDMIAMKEVQKYKDTPDCMLCAESLLDIGKLGLSAVAGVLRTTCRAITDPKSCLTSVKYLTSDPENAFRAVRNTISGSGVGSTAARIKYRIGSMQKTQECIATMESHPLTNYMIHFADADPKKRIVKNKRGNKDRDPLAVKCNLFIGSLRKKPHLWVYYMCPWFYPHCVSLSVAWKQFTDILLFVLAAGVWSPCIIAMEACRALMCCFMCTG